MKQSDIDAMGAFARGEEEPEVTSWDLWEKGWRPRLNPTQKEAKEAKARFKLYHGGRGGSKTFGCLHELVEHCFLNRNALAIIIVGVKRQAEEGGAWHKLQQEILPIWATGNKEIVKGQWTGNRYDNGIGLEYSEPTTNTAKDVYLWIRNRFGSGSRVLLLSMPVDSLVIDRVKGMEPSFVMIDEAQTLQSDTYFSSIIQQVGRRPGISTMQQVVYCANPEGPSHWLYNRFWVMPVDEETGEWDSNYARFHFPVEENKHNLPENYLEINVTEAVRGDDILKRRMLEGEWVDRPTGLAMFAEDFKHELHVMGDAIKGRGIVPDNRYPINLSYDLGAAHTSIDFQQIWPTMEKLWKVNFDEMDFVGQYIPYANLVPKIITRMIYWDNFEVRGAKVGPFTFKHISDSSAFNQYRAKDGSFDVWDIEMISKAYVQERPDIFFEAWKKRTGNPSGLTLTEWQKEDKGEFAKKYIIKLVECPKGPHSVEARVRLLKDAMQKEEYLVSAMCPRKIEMLNGLEEDEKERLKPKRSPQIHRFDSATYGFFYYGPGRGRHSLVTAPVDTGPAFYVCGRGRA